jgi:hypothetical protein
MIASSARRTGCVAGRIDGRAYLRSLGRSDVVQDRARLRTHRWVVVALTAVGSLLVVVLAVTSPFLMRWIAGPDATWTDVGNVGQAYGSAAAVLAAFAFLGIAVSVALQWHATSVQRATTARQQHFELLKLSFEFPVLRRMGWHLAISDDEELVCRYANLWVGYWAWLWDMGRLDEPSLRRQAANYLFTDPCVIAWWDQQMESGGWSDLRHNSHRMRFEAIITEEWARRAGRERPVSGRLEDVQKVCTNWIFDLCLRS